MQLPDDYRVLEQWASFGWLRRWGHIWYLICGPGRRAVIEALSGEVNISPVGCPRNRESRSLLGSRKTWKIGEGYWSDYFGPSSDLREDSGNSAHWGRLASIPQQSTRRSGECGSLSRIWWGGSCWWSEPLGSSLGASLGLPPESLSNYRTPSARRFLPGRRSTPEDSYPWRLPRSGPQSSPRVVCGCAEFCSRPEWGLPQIVPDPRPYLRGAGTHLGGWKRPTSTPGWKSWPSIGREMPLSWYSWSGSNSGWWIENTPLSSKVESPQPLTP